MGETAVRMVGRNHEPRWKVSQVDHEKQGSMPHVQQALLLPCAKYHTSMENLEAFMYDQTKDPIYLQPSANVRKTDEKHQLPRQAEPPKTPKHTACKIKRATVPGLSLEPLRLLLSYPPLLLRLPPGLLFLLFRQQQQKMASQLELTEYTANSRGPTHQN